MCCRLTKGTARRPGDICWLAQHGYSLLEAGEELVVLEALGKAGSSSNDAAGVLSGLELLRELACSTASGASCKLLLDCPPGANAAMMQVSVALWPPLQCHRSAQHVTRDQQISTMMLRTAHHKLL
jgi:hypothetical protein